MSIAIRLILLVFVAATLMTGRPAQAQLSAPEIEAMAERYQSRLATTSTPDTIDAAAILAEAKIARSEGRTGDAITALERLAASANVPPRFWLELAAAWRASTPRADQALASAHIAYTSATTDPERIEALLIMAGTLRDRLGDARKRFEMAQGKITTVDALARRRSEDEDGLTGSMPAESWAGRASAVRDSLIAADEMSRIARNLTDIYDDIENRIDLTEVEDRVAAETRPALFSLRERGSRDYDPDYEALAQSEAAVPQIDLITETEFSRICVFFTLPLDPDTRLYRRFVTLSDRTEEGAPQDVSLSGLIIEDEKLCVVDVVPGRDYRLTLFEGLPSRSKAELESKAITKFNADGNGDKVVIDFTAPDRDKLIGFRGEAFLLPEQATGHVPIYTVNIDTVPLHLMRITDRTLHRHIALGHIGGRMPYDEFAEMRDLFSEPLWNGRAEISGTRNKTIDSAIPVFDILNARSASGLPAQAAQSNTVLSRPMAPMTEANLRLTGEFTADPVGHQGPTEPPQDSGVYALLTETAESIDGRTEEAEAAEDRCVEECREFLVQWFVRTNIGLSVYAAPDEVHVVARALDTGAAAEGVDIELVTVNNRVLGEAKTDAFGVVRFPARLTRGEDGNKLAAILAHGENDFSFLAYGKDRLDLSRLGVDGRQRPDLLDGYLYTDRGIYRPGHTISTTVLLRDAAGLVPDVLPSVTVNLVSGETTVARRTVAPAQWRLGGASIDIPVPLTTLLGTYDLIAKVGDGNDAITIAESLVQIDQFRPDRARLRLIDAESWDVSAANDNTLSLQGQAYAQYLYGTPPPADNLASVADENRPPRSGSARGLRGEVEIRVAQAASPVPACYTGYNFGPVDRSVQPNLSRSVLGHSNTRGLLDIDLSGTLTIPETDHPLAATLGLVVYDSAGALASTTRTFPIKVNRDWIGVSTTPRIRPAPTGNEDPDIGSFGLSFDVIGLTADDQALTGREITWTVEQERDVFVWEQNSGTWDYRRDTLRDEIPAGGSEQRMILGGTSARGGDDCFVPGQTIDVDLPLGRYVLTVTDSQTNKTTSVRFVSGSQTADLDRLQPNMATITSDKARYEPGETIRLDIATPFDGEVLVAFADSSIHEFASASTSRRSATIEIEAKEDWAGRGLYALATVYRRNADGSLSRGPTRAIGATHFDIVGTERIGRLKVDAPRRAQPGSPIDVSLCLTDAGGDCREDVTETGYAMLYAVDEGLVSLTQHPIPNPQGHFFGQQRLPIDIMDNYSRIILRDEGGDRPSRLALSNYTSDVIVSKTIGPVPVVNGRAEIPLDGLDMDDGTLRLAAMVWLPELAASAESSVTVRGAIVSRLELPKFFTPGDQPVVPLLLDNVASAADGPFSVQLGLPDDIAILDVKDSAGNSMTLSGKSFSTDLPRGDPKRFAVTLGIPANLDNEAINVALSVTPGAQTIAIASRSRTVPIRPAIPKTLELLTVELAPDGDILDLRQRLNDILQGRYEPDGLELQAEFSATGGLTFANLVEEEARDRLPSLETLVWRGMILLASTTLNADSSAELVSIIDNVQALNAAYDGSFMPYRTVDDHTPQERNLLMINAETDEEKPGILRMAMVLDFLTNAKDAGLPVSRAMLDTSVDVLNREFGERLFSADSCRPYVIYSAITLIDYDQIRRRDVDSIYDCISNTWNPRLSLSMIAALATKFGDNDRLSQIVTAFAEARPREYEPELLEHAMILAFLQEADWREVEGADALLAEARTAALPGEEPQVMSLAHAAWLARANPNQTVGNTTESSAGPPKLEIGPDEIMDGAEIISNSALRTRLMSLADLNTTGLNVRNAGTEPVTASILVRGRALPEQTDIEQFGYAVSRHYLNSKGEKVDISANPIKVGDIFTVVIEARGQKPDWNRHVREQFDQTPLLRQSNLALTIVDLLPSGFSIIEPNAYAPTTAGPALPEPEVGRLRFIEARDDRLAAIVLPQSAQIDPNEDPSDNVDPSAIDLRMAYRVRAGAAGRYILPPVLIEPIEDPNVTYRTGASEIVIEPAQQLN